MACIVRKYGGTSVGDVETHQEGRRAHPGTRDEGNELVVVVSARAGVTNELIARAKAVCADPASANSTNSSRSASRRPSPSSRWRCRASAPTRSATPDNRPALFTDKVHTKAKIKGINPKPIEKDLKAGRVIIVAGFQGADEDGRITTLGQRRL